VPRRPLRASPVRRPSDDPGGDVGSFELLLGNSTASAPGSVENHPENSGGQIRARGAPEFVRGTQFGFWAMDKRQICWAHLIRKFASFAERSGSTGQLGAQLLFWSQAMMHYWHMVRDGTMSRRRFRKLMISIQPIVEDLLDRGVRLDVRGVSGSCKDILAHKLALWTFVDQEGIEPTNNHAERELRGFVLWRKKCFGSQSDRGNRFAARIMTVAHSLRKQQRHVLEYLTEACRAALDGRPAPSLLPAMSTP
jgi:transposase